MGELKSRIARLHGQKKADMDIWADQPKHDMSTILSTFLSYSLVIQIEEFPIIGFYLYHVTSAGQSSNWTTSGIKQYILFKELLYIGFNFI